MPALQNAAASAPCLLLAVPHGAMHTKCQRSGALAACGLQLGQALQHGSVIVLARRCLQALQLVQQVQLGVLSLTSRQGRSCAAPAWLQVEQYHAQANCRGRGIASHPPITITRSWRVAQWMWIDGERPSKP